MYVYSNLLSLGALTLSTCRASPQSGSQSADSLFFLPAIHEFAKILNIDNRTEALMVFRTTLFLTSALTGLFLLGASVMRFILSVRPWLHFLRAMLFGFAFAFLAVATTGLLLSFTQCTQPGDELGLPSPEVGFDAAMFAFSHVAVALPSRQHAMSTELPEPPIDIFANLVKVV